MQSENDRWAEFYDELHDWLDPQPCVEFIRRRYKSGPVGEFCVGTGRIAVPLARAGMKVYGIDISRPMVERLDAKSCPGVIGIVGDACTTQFPEKVDLAYIVFNSLFAIASLESQQLFFSNASRQLADGGCLIVEGYVPNHAGFSQSCRFFEPSETRKLVVRSRHNRVTQHVDLELVYFRDDRMHRLTAATRYVHLSEMDLMAKLSGLVLVERYGDWSEAPLSDASDDAISVYKKSG